jgi:hypothetical protein
VDDHKQSGVDAVPHAIEVARGRKGERLITFEVGNVHGMPFADGLSAPQDVRRS